MNRRSSQIAVLVVLAAIAPALGARASAADTVLSGVVRDAKGAPQMGALVQLLSSNSVVIEQAYTNLHGAFAFPRVLPGTYQLKATCVSFLPTLRENLKIRGNRRTVVDVTLNTLFEAIQWLPAQPRAPGESADDWKWTLRSANNRPLLRFLQDGPLVVVTGERNQKAPQLEARVVLTSASRNFGQAAPHGAFEIERTAANGGHLILQADSAPAYLGQSQFLAGLEQPLGLGGAVRTVAAVQRTNGLQGSGGLGSVQTTILRGSESLNLGSNLTAEFGSQMESIRGPGEVFSNSPFAMVSWQAGNGRISYMVSNSPVLQRADQVADPASFAPQFSESDGRLRVEHGLHQELRVEDYQARLRALIDFYHDEIENPVIGGGGAPMAQDLAGGNLLFDPLSGAIRATGPNFSATGMTASIDRRFGSSTWASFSYSQGTALVSPVSRSATTTPGEALRALRARQAQAFTSQISGKVPHVGTFIRASYRWQPVETVTSVAPYDNVTQDAYLSLLVRQPIRCGRILPNGTEALIAVRNLLAEGYRPFLTPDGSTLYFARTNRSVVGGLAFSF